MACCRYEWAKASGSAESSHNAYFCIRAVQTAGMTDCCFDHTQAPQNHEGAPAPFGTWHATKIHELANAALNPIVQWPRTIQERRVGIARSDHTEPVFHRPFARHSR